MKKTLLLLSLFFVTCTLSFSQSGNTQISTQKIQTKYHNNPKYRVKHFYKNYRLVTQSRRESNQNPLGGILKDTSLLLPIKFAYNYRENEKLDNQSILLSLAKYCGLFNFEKEKWTIPLLYRSLLAVNDEPDLFIAQKDAFKGIVDKDNNEILAINWNNIENVYGMKNFVLLSKKTQNDKLLQGLYDVNDFEMVLNPEYKKIKYLNGTDYFSVSRKDGVHNIFDKRGNFLFDNWYSELDVIYGTPISFIVKKGENVGIINETEKEIVPFEYSEINPRSYNDGSYLAKNQTDKYGFITKEGKVILPFIYDKIERGKATAISYKDDKCGIIQINNGLPYEIATCDYESIIATKKAFIAKKDGKFGLMDLYGGEITGVIYDKLTPFAKDYFIAKSGAENFLFSANGEQLNLETYLSISPLNDINTYHRDSFFYIKVKNKEQKVGLIDKLGTVIVEPNFEDILSEQWNVLVVKKGEKFGLYSIKEKTMIAPYEYDQIVFTPEGFYSFQGNTIYSISEEGERKKIN